MPITGKGGKLKNPNILPANGKPITDIPLKEREKSAQNYEDHLRQTKGFTEGQIRKEVNEFRAQLGLPSLDELNLAQKMRAWIQVQSGTFRNADIINELSLEKNQKGQVSVYLARFMEEGLIKRDGRASGIWRRIEGDLTELNFKNPQTGLVNLKFPFGIEKYVKILPGSIIVVAGAVNAGKTAFMLNFIAQNMHAYEIRYLTSEMSDRALNERLSNFEEIDPPIPLNDWSFKAYPCYENFSDHVLPGRGRVTVVDYLELHTEFYLIAQHLAEIHRKLDGGIAVVGLQKNPGVDAGLGGQRSLEKPSLYIAMDSKKLKLVKAKTWATARNPNGLEIHFDLVKGAKFIQKDKWSFPG
jgi:hypothetical protein